MLCIGKIYGIYSTASNLKERLAGMQGAAEVAKRELLSKRGCAKFARL